MTAENEPPQMVPETDWASSVAPRDEAKIRQYVETKHRIAETHVLTPFFGNNTPHTWETQHVHPCRTVARELHACLDAKRNDFYRCREFTNKLELCLRERNM